MTELRLHKTLDTARKSQAAIKQAQRRLARKSQKKQRVPGVNAIEYANFVMVFTTLPGQQAKAPQVLEYYRLRWQIELVFKRLKSIVQLGHVPKQDDESSRA